MTDPVTIPNAPRSTTVVANNSIGPFPVGFTIFDPAGADLEVTVDGVVTTAWAFNGTTVAGFDGAPNTYVDGSLLFIAPITGSLVIRGKRAPRRTTVFPEGKGVPARDLNYAFNVVTAVCRELYDRFARALSLGVGDTDGSGAYDAKLNRIKSLGAPTASTDAARLADVQAATIAAGNVPSPLLAEVGFYLKATSTGVFAWATNAAATTVLAANITDATTAGRNFLKAANLAAQQTILGLGTLAFFNSVTTALIAAKNVTIGKLADFGGTAKLLGSGASGPDAAEITLGGGLVMTGSVLSAPGGAKAWVNFDGATGTIRASSNVASVTRNGTGDYTINFTNNMADANYASVCSAGTPGARAFVAQPNWTSAPAVGSFRMLVNTDSGSFTDATYVHVAVFGN